MSLTSMNKDEINEYLDNILQLKEYDKLFNILETEQSSLTVNSYCSILCSIHNNQRWESDTFCNSKQFVPYFEKLFNSIKLNDPIKFNGIVVGLLQYPAVFSIPEYTLLIEYLKAMTTTEQIDFAIKHKEHPLIHESCSQGSIYPLGRANFISLWTLVPTIRSESVVDKYGFSPIYKIYRTFKEEQQYDETQPMYGPICNSTLCMYEWWDNERIKEGIALDSIENAYSALQKDLFPKRLELFPKYII